MSDVKLDEVIMAARKLSQDERTKLVQAVSRMYEEVVDDSVMLTPAQREDLKKRIEEYRAGEAEMIPGDEVIARLRNRFGGGVPMTAVSGQSPAGNRARCVDIWVDERGVHLWIHPPGSDNQSGWEVAVDREQLVNALREENVIR